MQPSSVRHNEEPGDCEEIVSDNLNDFEAGEEASAQVVSEMSHTGEVTEGTKQRAEVEITS